ncbi:MAG: hypothetical protein GY762_15025 [Proteobacteria bacterium]|nr:hypothetical protein [Pseudomonadota bacterium]
MGLRNFALTAFLLVILIGISPAQGEKKIQCDVMTIQASNAGKGVDKRLKKYEQTFKQPPFSAYNTYELVHRQTYKMPANTPVSLRLPESLGGSLRLNKMVKGQLDLTLSLVRKGKSPVNIQGKAASGAPFFAAGFKNPGGVWIFGVVCKNKQ